MDVRIYLVHGRPSSLELTGPALQMRYLGVLHDFHRETAVGSLLACSGPRSREVGWGLQWEPALGKRLFSGQNLPPMALEHLHEQPSGALPLRPPVQANRRSLHRYQL